MRVVWSGLLAGFFPIFAGFLTASAVGAVPISQIQYEFDVLDVGFHFVESNSPATDSPDYAMFIDAVHPLADLRDRTFRMGVTLTDISAQFPALQQDYDPATEILSTIECTFGPVCESGGGLFRTFPAGLQPPTGLATPDGRSFRTDSLFTGDFTIFLNVEPTGGTGIFYLQTDIDDFLTFAEINGSAYYAQGPGITLTLGNIGTGGLAAPPPAAVPLPAPVFLLGAGLIPLALLRRRRKA